MLGRGRKPWALAGGWGGHRVPQDLFQLPDVEHNFPGRMGSEFLDSGGMEEWLGESSLSHALWAVLSQALFMFMCAQHRSPGGIHLGTVQGSAAGLLVSRVTLNLFSSVPDVELLPV